MIDFGYVVTAMATPFTESGVVNLEEAIRLGDFLVDNKTQTILLSGTTGESPTLSHDEEEQLFQVMCRSFKGRALIMAGTGSNCTATAIEATQRAEKIGVDASLQVVPYYNRPCQEGIYAHFKAIASQTFLPIMLYNIPGRTGRNLEPETVARLAQIPNIIGIKEAAGSVDQVKKIKALVPPDFKIYSGDDALTLSFMDSGACGVVSVASHCAGTQIFEMINAFVDGDKPKAYMIEQILKPLFDVLFITTNPAPVKAALDMMGFKMGGLRLPLIAVNETQKTEIQMVLQQLGLVS